MPRYWVKKMRVVRVCQSTRLEIEADNPETAANRVNKDDDNMWVAENQEVISTELLILEVRL